jgi:GT2 family glycosyltransferase
VRSVLAQTIGDLEVIVVDDGSRDRSLEALRRQVSDVRLLTIRHDTNRGGSAARNTGIAHATSPWVGFLDSDDTWSPGRLAAQLPLLEAGEDGVGYCAVANLLDGRITPTLPRRRPSGHVFRDVAAGHAPMPTSSLLVRRDLLADHRFDERLQAYQDYDLVLGLATATTFHALPDALVVFDASVGERVTLHTGRNAAALAYLRCKWLEEAQRRGCGEEFLGACRALEWGLEAKALLHAPSEAPFSRRARHALGAFALPELPYDWRATCAKLLLGRRRTQVAPLARRLRRLGD